jgi:CBS domain-containing protein
MKVGDLLPVERIVTPLPAKTVHDAAEQLIGSFVDTGLAAEPSKLLERLSETPARDAVTVGDGAFILHFRSDAVRGLGGALGVTAQPVLLASDSDRSAQVVVVLVAPHKESPLYLQAIAVLDRVLSVDDVIGRIVAARSPAEIHDIQSLADAELPGYLTVGDVMLGRPRSVWPDATVDDVAKVMIANRISAIPVTSTKGEVLGMVTNRDLLRAAFPSFFKRMSGGYAKLEGAEDVQDPRKLPIREVMDRTVLCVSDDQTLHDVANAIISKAVDRIPVVRDGVLVGLLTRADIVRRIFGP